MKSNIESMKDLKDLIVQLDSISVFTRLNVIQIERLFSFY